MGTAHPQLVTRRFRTVPIVVGALALLGLAVGSFVNVVAHRVPAGASLVAPGSHCPHCLHPVRPRHLVPVLGFLALRGRCADCRCGISARYPLVELGTAALFVGLGHRIVGTGAVSVLPAVLVFTGLGVALSLIDVQHHRLPNALVLPAYPVLAVLLVGAAALSGEWGALARAGVGGAGLYGLYLTLAVARPGGMGFGDVKLAGLIGAVLGYLSWSALLVGAAAAFLLGGVLGVAVVLARRGDRRSAVPFGPFMVAGALLAVLVAEPVAAAYLRLVHLS